MMSKDKKKTYIEEMKSFFTKTSSVFVTHYQGLTVKQIDELKIFDSLISINEESFTAIPILEKLISALLIFNIDFSPTDIPLSPHFSILIFLTR